MTFNGKGLRLMSRKGHAWNPFYLGNPSKLNAIDNLL